MKSASLSFPTALDTINHSCCETCTTLHLELTFFPLVHIFALIFSKRGLRLGTRRNCLNVQLGTKNVAQKSTFSGRGSAQGHHRMLWIKPHTRPYREHFAVPRLVWRYSGCSLFFFQPISFRTFIRPNADYERNWSKSFNGPTDIVSKKKLTLLFCPGLLSPTFH